MTPSRHNRVILRPDGLPARVESFPDDLHWAVWDVSQEQVGLLAVEGIGPGTLSPIVDVYAAENVTAKDPAHHWAIGRAGYTAATAWAKEHGLSIVGQIHTHVADGPEPSPADYKALPAGGLGAVWHLRTGALTWFTKNGVLGRETLHPASWVDRWLARLYCAGEP